MNRNKKLVEVYRVSGEAQAKITPGLLESHRIPSLLKSLAAPWVHVFTVAGMGEYRVMVWESSYEKSKEIVREEEYD